MVTDEHGNGSTARTTTSAWRPTTRPSTARCCWGSSARAQLGAREVEVVNDSQLVARQMTGEYRVKKDDLRPLHAQALAALRGFERWSIRSVPREQNEHADDARERGDRRARGDGLGTAERRARLRRPLKSPAGRTAALGYDFSEWQATIRQRPADCSSAAAPGPRRCAIASGRSARAGMRRRLDAVLAGAILVVETLLCTTLWGPQPAAWLWIGSRIFHETDSIGLGDPDRVRGHAGDDPRHARDRDAARPRMEDRAPRQRPRAEGRHARDASS